MKTPIQVNIVTNSMSGISAIEAMYAVIVVPMFAPMITVVAWNSDISPALTKPTTMTVVAEELWMIAVTAVPMPTPARRLLLVLSNQPRRRLVASFSMLSDNTLNPNKKAPSPASNDTTERT